MATWKHDTITLENGMSVLAQTPEIVSASRSTDIPAFYADWFLHRLKIGYSAWKNPFNGKTSYVSYKNTRFIVFWSKNPKPLIPYLDELRERGIACYVQYSLNDYENEKLERGVPRLQERIDTFKRLVDQLGVGGVIWRFDPLMLTDSINVDLLLDKVSNIGDQLKGYTEKLVFSYADMYSKVKTNLCRNGIQYREWSEDEMLVFAKQLSAINGSHGWNYRLATCGEKVDLVQFGIEHNHCVDDTLIIRRAYHDKKLMDFLGVRFFPMPQNTLFGDDDPLPADAIVLPNGMYATKGDNRDKGQREFCGCMKSKDIGEYNTCVHLCEYCYANTSKEVAYRNWQLHKTDRLRESIV